MTDQLDAPLVVVNRWTRYGHDRAYVSSGEQQWGHRDLRTGDVVCGDPAHRAAVEAATEPLWRAARSTRYEPRHAEEPVTTGAGAAAPRTVPVTPLLPDHDLAGNRPGQGPREQARELRDAAPVRTVVERILGRRTDERAWRIGADAEEAVARRLDRLGPPWRVLHSVPVGERGSDIDHVVIGPGGVFTVNAKNHPDARVWVRGDAVTVNGRFQPYVRNSRYEATRAASMLTRRAGFDVQVRGVVAIMGMSGGFEVVDQPHDGSVAVVQRKRVADHLAAQPPVLDVAAIERIFAVARHAATWQPRHVGWSNAF